MTNLYGSLEAGGTKFICAVADEEFNTVEELQFPTTTPQETLKKTADFFTKFKNLAAIGIGSFGPIDVDLKSKTYGYITTTPKPNWSNVDVVGTLKKRVDVPIYFTTDVNSSAYGEVYARNNRGENIETLVYYTIGTGNFLFCFHQDLILQIFVLDYILLMLRFFHEFDEILIILFLHM